ncbi:MAG: ATP-binding protein [Firmicutes bacterium HGW-Firmicutes-19]|jgi:fluoroquinolone transport system ATP-binding protein|nr:MAG: ATP-binding protein [Firmicutes bacterium HGW-Firmicutes-19]
MFKVKDLQFQYPKNTSNTINGIDFDIAKGEIFGFLGPSGAGKTTTQKLMVKLLSNYKGYIEFDGKDLSKFHDEFYEDIGVCFEMPISFSKLTAMENLDFFRKLYKRQVDVQPLMERLGLWEDKDKLVGEYSKGMKIRLNMVRALLNDPKMLFLDEPTNGLDPKNARIVKDMIRDFRNGGGTVFLTSHIMGDVDELCDRVAFITDGKLVEVDSPRNLKLKYGKRTVAVEYRNNGDVVKEVFTMDQIREQAFMDLIASKNIETIHSGETTLEEIFIQVTGVKLHGED